MASLRWGRVAAIHPEDYAVDLVMTDDGSRLAGVQVLAPHASTSSGSNCLPNPATPKSGDAWDLRETTDRDVLAGVAFFGQYPVVLGFRFPQVCQMLFKDLERAINRHPSDFYTSIDGQGNFEAYHPSGTFLRIGTSPEHEDLTGKDFDGKWKIARNTDKAVHVHLTVANGGSTVASLDIDPSGNVTLEHAGNYTQKVGGTYTVESTGAATIKAPSVTHDAPQTTSTGNQSVQGAMNVQGEGASGAVSTFAGTIKINGGDVVADDISLKQHKTSGVQPGGGTSGAPVP